MEEEEEVEEAAAEEEEEEKEEEEEEEEEECGCVCLRSIFNSGSLQNAPLFLMKVKKKTT